MLRALPWVEEESEAQRWPGVGQGRTPGLAQASELAGLPIADPACFIHNDVEGWRAISSGPYTPCEGGEPGPRRGRHLPRVPQWETAELGVHLIPGPCPHPVPFPEAPLLYGLMAMSHTEKGSSKNMEAERAEPRGSQGMSGQGVLVRRASRGGPPGVPGLTPWSLLHRVSVHSPPGSGHTPSSPPGLCGRRAALPQRPHASSQVGRRAGLLEATRARPAQPPGC